MILNETEIYTPEETRKILKISDSTFRRLIKKGILRVARIGGQYRVLVREILRLLNSNLPSKVKNAYHEVVKKLGDDI